jgi:hypothetical protein
LRGRQRIGRQRVREPFEAETLDAVSRSDFNDNEIALRVRRQMMRALEVAGRGTSRTKLIEDREALAIHHHDVRVAVVGEIHELLGAIG